MTGGDVPKGAVGIGGGRAAVGTGAVGIGGIGGVVVPGGPPNRGGPPGAGRAVRSGRSYHGWVTQADEPGGPVGAAAGQIAAGGEARPVPAPRPDAPHEELKAAYPDSAAGE
ncbi:MAG: hypothetical protein LBG60_15330 [Bifidobacteriaceae bacterium]|nr:hypothetical protein [Bifidobacteriaceae bacterium]